MKYIHSSETLNVPEGGECHCFPESMETGEKRWTKFITKDFELAHWENQQLLT
jgi:hypothetical protein